MVEPAVVPDPKQPPSRVLHSLHEIELSAVEGQRFVAMPRPGVDGRTQACEVIVCRPNDMEENVMHEFAKSERPAVIHDDVLAVDVARSVTQQEQQRAVEIARIEHPLIAGIAPITLEKPRRLPVHHSTWT